VKPNHLNLYFLTMTLLLIIAGLLGIAIGSTEIPIEVVGRVLVSKLLPTAWGTPDNDSQAVVIWLIRTPRVLVAALVGAALAIAGTQMQGLFQNPLASPDLLGSSSGGALGAVIALATGLATHSVYYIPLFASIGAWLALVIVYLLARQRGQTPVTTLLLAGVALNALLGAMTALIITLSSVPAEMSREIIFWLIGGLDSRTWTHVWIILPFVLSGGLMALFYTRDLDILLLGEETAYSLGVEVAQVTRVILISTALLTGAAVAVSGVVGFVGLIIPHIVRLLIGPKHRSLIPASALLGATFLILADLLARIIHRPEEVRLGILTAVFGAPFFLYLLLRQHRSQ
jgi:iron complex transport system permease protein